MSEWVGVLIFVGAILAVVLIHESGHFLSAKAFGIKVEEFFVGFGPRLWSFRRGETEYGVKALPLGGYVRIAGMNPFQDTPPEDLPRTFGAKPIWQRALVILAGPLTHFVMAIVFLAVFFMAIGVPDRFRPEVDGVEATLNGRPSPAAVAGFRPGDVILSVDSVQVPVSKDPDLAGQPFVDYTRAHVGQPLRITVLRDGRTLTLMATPVLSTVGGQKVGRFGVELGVKIAGRDRLNPFVAVGRGFTTTKDLVVAIFGQLGNVFGPAGIRRIGQLLGGAQRRPEDPTSVVGGARLAGEAVKAGNWDVLFNMLVVFNVFIGIINLVPLPPLDGGHLAVLAYEKVRRRKPDVRKLVPLTVAVAGFMILLVVSLMYLDVFRPPHLFP